MKDKAHYGAAGEKDLPANGGAGQFRVERFQKLPDAEGGQFQTRAPILESIKMFRRRKGGGELIRR